MATNDDRQPDKHPMRWLGQDRDAAGVLVVAHRLIALEASIRKVLPSALTNQISVSAFEQGVLEITTYNSAQTAKLRQLKTTLCNRLMSDGWNIKDVRLRISATPAPGTRAKVPERLTRPLQTEDLDHFESLAQNLKPGRLAEAIKALLKHHDQKGK